LKLTEVQGGGETSFPEADLMIKPKKGAAIFWQVN
jgi:hypothetical protein